MPNYTPWVNIETKASTNKSEPKISVIIPTNRAGGLDLTFESLKAQTYKNFELVLVDSIYKYRKNTVEEKSKQYDFAVKHVEPHNNIFPVANYCQSVNKGLCVADGDIAYFTCDYSYMQKDILLTHAKFHSITPKTHVLMMPTSDMVVKLEKVSNKFPKERQYGHRGKPDDVKLLIVSEEQYVRAHNEWSDRYAEDLEKGLLDDVLWSIFDKEFKYGDNLNDIALPVVHDTKFSNCSTTTATSAFHDLCGTKNDSFKRELLMEANGFEEEMDGTHGWQDSEMVRRLIRCYGAQFFAMNTLENIVINTRYYLEPRKIIKGYNNWKIIERKYNNEKPLTNNSIVEFKKDNK